MLPRCTFISLLVLSFAGLSGQVNIRIAYNLGFPDAPEVDRQVALFNEQNAAILEQPMETFDFMQGIGLGVRYKVDDSRYFELGWDNMGKSYLAVGELPDDRLFKEELFYSMNQFSLAYENHFGIFGIGTAILYNRIKIRNEIADSDFKKTICQGNQWAARIQTSLNFRSSRSVAFALKPYIQIPLSSISLSGLGPELTGQSSDVDEDFSFWGISLTFYNGRQ